MSISRFCISLALIAVLTGCSGWKVVYTKTLPVTLSAEQVAKFESDVAKWDGLLTNYKPEQSVAIDSVATPETKKVDSQKDASATPTPEKIPTKQVKPPEIDSRPPFDFFVEKARALTSLGKVGQAIRTYDDALTMYEISIVGWNNLAKLYESIGDYTTAITYYEKILERFSDDEIYLSIAKDALADGNRIKARDAYIAYLHKTGNHDTDIEQALDLKLPVK